MNDASCLFLFLAGTDQNTEDGSTIFRMQDMATFREE